MELGEQRRAPSTGATWLEQSLSTQVGRKQQRGTPSAPRASDDAGSGTEGLRAAFTGQPLADTSRAGVGLL